MTEISFADSLKERKNFHRTMTKEKRAVYNSTKKISKNLMLIQEKDSKKYGKLRI